MIGINLVMAKIILDDPIVSTLGFPIERSTEFKCSSAKLPLKVCKSIPGYLTL